MDGWLDSSLQPSNRFIASICQAIHRFDPPSPVSLKAFHIVFIVASILLSIGFGVWALLGFLDAGGAFTLIVALASFGVGVLLVAYGIRFVHRLKHVGYW